MGVSQLQELWVVYTAQAEEMEDGWGNLLCHSTGRGARPRYIYLNLGLQAWARWPPPTNLSPTLNSQTCPQPERPFPGVHLMPPEPPREQHCLCVGARGLPALPRDGWASRPAPIPCTQTPARPAPRTPDPGQWAVQGRRRQAGMRPSGPGNTATWAGVQGGVLKSDGSSKSRWH